MSRSHGWKGINVGGWPDLFIPLSSQEQMNAAQGDGRQAKRTGRDMGDKQQRVLVLAITRRRLRGEILTRRTTRRTAEQCAKD